MELISGRTFEGFPCLGDGEDVTALILYAQREGGKVAAKGKQQENSAGSRSIGRTESPSAHQVAHHVLLDHLGLIREKGPGPKLSKT